MNGLCKTLLFLFGMIIMPVMAAPYLYPVCLTPAAKSELFEPSALLEAVIRERLPIQAAEPNSQTMQQQTPKKPLNRASNTPPTDAWQAALTAYHHARALGYDSQQILTIVDYALPSDQNRLWVYNMKTNRMILHTLVAHGTQTGARYAKHFSNQMDSHQSSLGVFLTATPYDGAYGYSLRLIGLEPKFNGNAYERAIVVHPATYVSPFIARKYHMIGRSFGCLAVSSTVDQPLVNTIKSGTLVVDYYPDKAWLKQSDFLKPTK